MITIVKETNYYHPDMHLHTQGVSQDEIAEEFESRMNLEEGIIVNHIRETRADGKEYITHVSYTGPTDKVEKVAAEHDIIEAENSDMSELYVDTVE